MRCSLLTFCLLLSLPNLRAQNPSSENDCFGSSLVTLRFEDLKEGQQKVRELSYGKKDRFSFWYRLEKVPFDTLEVVVSSTDPKDIYDISLYRYDGKAICKELVHGDRSPLGIGSLEEESIDQMDGTHHPVAFQDKALEKGGSYFLSVLHVGGKGCGHIARIRADGKELEIRAKAKDCFQIQESRSKKAPKKKPSKLRLRTGLLDSAKHRSIAGELMLMDRKTGNKRFIDMKSDSTRTLKLHKGRTYRFKGEALGYHSKSVERSFDSDSSFFLRLRSLDKGEKIVLRRIYFHPNTYAFRDQSRSSLEALYRYMQQRPKAVIEIQGHTASDQTIENINPLYKDKGPAWKFTGTAKELSLLRAKAVKEELVEMGIDPERLRTKGFGASRKMVKDARSRREEKKNMRVEVRILQ